MDLVSQRMLIFHIQVLGLRGEDSILNGMKIMEVGLNTAKKRKRHIAFVVFYLGIAATRKKLGMTV